MTDRPGPPGDHPTPPGDHPTPPTLPGAPTSSIAATAASATHGFLFADLRGYTAYLDRNGAAAAAALLTRFRQLVRSAVKSHAGAEIRTEGDSFYVVFPSASSAVACALDIVRAAGDEVVHPDDAIQVGVGVHAGEALETPEGPVGTAVNIAARLCSMAGPGEVVVSDTVRALTRSVGSAGFVALGRRPIKGLDEALTVYRAVPAGTVVAASSGGRAGRRWPIVAAVVGGIAVIGSMLLLAGPLAGQPAPSASPTSGASPAASSAAGSPPPAGSASPAASGDVMIVSVPPLDETYEPMALVPGRYRLEEFRPTTEFEVFDDSWMATEELPDGFTIGREDGIITGGIVQVVYSGACHDAPTETIDQDPKSLVDWLQANPALVTTDPRSANLGSWSGLTIDLESAGPQDCAVPADFPEALQERLRTAVYLFYFGDNTFWLGPNEKARLIVVDVDGRPVTVLAGGYAAADFEAFMEDAQPILDSFRFTASG
jgi:class 3 adenylate cyclase